MRKEYRKQYVLLALVVLIAGIFVAGPVKGGPEPLCPPHTVCNTLAKR